MADYKLLSFNDCFISDAIRLLFQVAGIEYEDIRIPCSDWPAQKFKMPFGQLPVLEFQGQLLGQSHTIMRFLARQFGMAGKTDWDQAQVDAVAAQWKDFEHDIEPYLAMVHELTDADEAMIRTLVVLPTIYDRFPAFCKVLQENRTGLLVGKTMSWIDVTIAAFVAKLLERDEEVFANYPEMISLKNRVLAAFPHKMTIIRSKSLMEETPSHSCRRQMSQQM